MHRVLTCIVAVSVIGSPSVAAADDVSARVISALDTSTRFIEDFVRSAPSRPTASSAAQIVWSVDRPTSFPALSLTYQALSGLDWFTTVRALNNGHREGNPTLAPLTTHPTALLLTKSASTAATLYLAERLWKRDRPAAIALMVAVNIIQGVVVVHNTSVGGRPGPRR